MSDHLEVLYDIDIEAKSRAKELGIRLERTELPNASPALLRTLAGVVQDAARRPPALPRGDSLVAAGA